MFYFIVYFIVLFHCQEADELVELFEQARDRIDEKVESVQNASTKVQDLQSTGDALVKNLQSKLERILGKNER